MRYGIKNAPPPFSKAVVFGTIWICSYFDFVNKIGQKIVTLGRKPPDIAKTDRHRDTREQEFDPISPLIAICLLVQLRIQLIYEKNKV